MGLRELCDALMMFLYPPRCPACGRYLEQRGAWCSGCLAHAHAVRRLRMTTDERAVLAEAWALGVYDGALKQLVQQLKYRKRMETLPYVQTFLRSVAPEFFRQCLLFPSALGSKETSGANSMRGTIAANSACATPPLVAVPVPLYAKKERQRGFNQTELLFRDELAAHGIPMERLLVRTRATKPQYGLSKDERKVNMRGAFAVLEEKKGAVRGRDILLLDDIYTTGVTCAECARALKRAGAARIVALALTSGQK